MFRSRAETVESLAFLLRSEFERELTRSRVRSGLAAARKKGKRFGRPRVLVDAQRVFVLRNNGASWSAICRATGLSKGTAQRALYGLPKNHCGHIPSGV